jgi:8-oxo-dGTP diphosphatase
MVLVPQRVVGAAILADHDGTLHVLAGERSSPPALAGRWEFPGGKVEPGETDEQALVRECREELGVTIRVGARLGPDLPIPGDTPRVLRVYEAALTGGQPVAGEHSRIAWLSADRLASVPWLITNLPLLATLGDRLRISS